MEQIITLRILRLLEKVGRSYAGKLTYWRGGLAFACQKPGVLPGESTHKEMSTRQSYVRALCKYRYTLTTALSAIRCIYLVRTISGVTFDEQLGL
jgi:hypothetical protein